MPPGQESSTEFVQKTSISYKEAYRLISKQMRACYRGIGPFGNGYDTNAELDTEIKKGVVELYHVGPSGVSKFDDSALSRTVEIEENGTGSVITTKGTTPSITYRNHLVIKAWLDGRESCSPSQ